MTTIYLAIQCGPDYDVGITAHATRELAELEVCAWLDDYGHEHQPDINIGQTAIMEGETAYMSGGEHWFEVRAVEVEPALNPEQMGRDTQAARDPEPRDVIGGLIEYAERYAEQNDERDDGDCRETIAAARAILEAGFTVA